uniref:Uncharacterized protein n=1 Tax=Cacopsylla melanoneura TaxID=428564 RepID=A0A8D8RXK2_9HEMI
MFSDIPHIPYTNTAWTWILILPLLYIGNNVRSVCVLRIELTYSWIISMLINKINNSIVVYYTYTHIQIFTHTGRGCSVCIVHLSTFNLTIKGRGKTTDVL